MSGSEITYEDVREYEKLFTLAPSFLMQSFARRNSNIVSKFKPQILSHLAGLNANQKDKLGLILNSDVESLQKIMDEAYRKTHIKQYKILADPKHKEFIKINLDEIRKLV